MSGKDFIEVLSHRCAGLLRIAISINRCDDPSTCFTRSLLGEMLYEASSVEELLDACGARRNLKWGPFRQAVAATKLFSHVAYVLLHIKLFYPSYKLLPIGDDFESATDEVFAFTRRTLTGIAGCILSEATDLGMTLPDLESSFCAPDDEVPTGALPANKPSTKEASAEKTVVYLATAFLNLAEDSKFLRVTPGLNEDFGRFIPEPINEERLRNTEEKFHNLQARYDTYVSDTNLELLDENLSVLRGHISVIYHLLQTATAFTHYIERHIYYSDSEPFPEAQKCLNEKELLAALGEYSINFVVRYIALARDLCREMLKKYAVRGEIKVPAPRYRGFHVRPSTMIAKIANHYGSDVEMQLNGDAYDASVALELFRANEKLNAKKRRALAADIGAILAENVAGDLDDYHEFIRNVARLLFENKKIVLYERAPIVDSDIVPAEEETPIQFAVRAFYRLFTMGKIDVELNATVTFRGDMRVLDDIRLLAENGYGEDDFGNNLPLPPELRYLRT